MSIQISFCNNWFRAERPESITEAWTLDGQSIPSSSLWEKEINGGEITGLDIVHAAIYRTEAQTNWAVVRQPQADDEILWRGEDQAIIRRTEQGRVRPLAKDVVTVRLEDKPEDGTFLRLIQLLKAEGLTPVSLVGSKLFASADPEATLSRFNPNWRGNASTMTRAGVLMKRPGGIALTLRIPTESTWSDAENDGTVLISRQLSEPLPGTLVVGDAFLKGMIRPPLVIDGHEEAEGHCKDAQFGQATPNEPTGTFYPVRDLPRERAGLNLQAVLFGAEDPAGIIRADNARLNELMIEDLLGAEGRRKVRAGVPIPLLLGEVSPWKWATQLDCVGVRAPVFATNLVTRGEIWMLPETYREFRKASEGSLPKIVILHRDPALPDASSFAPYLLMGECRWATSDAGRGLVINPFEESWKAAGGDFDGDAALCFAAPYFTLHDRVEEREDLKINVKRPLTIESLVQETLDAFDGFSGRLGAIITAGLRLAEIGALNNETRAKISSAAQASVSSQKHPTDTVRGYELFNEIRALVPKGEYFLDSLRNIRNAADKAEAWRDFIDQVLASEHGSDVQEALKERGLILHELYESIGWLREAKTVLPDRLRNAAKEALMEVEGIDVAEQAAWVQGWAQDLRNLMRQLHGRDEDDEDADADRELLRVLRNELAQALAKGDVHPFAVVAWAPHRTAAEIVGARWFEELNQRPTQFEVPILGTIEDGLYQWGQLRVVPSELARDPKLQGIDPAMEVRVNVMRVTAKTTRVIVTL